METEILFQGNRTFPRVTFQNGSLKIAGRSININHEEWWKMILNNLNILLQNKTLKQVHISLEYINSESNRWLIHLLYLIDNFNFNSNAIKIYWHCSPSDELMLEQVSVFASIIDTPIEIVFE